jgi:hypothetical protein
LFEVNDTDLFPITFEGSYSHSIEVSGGSGILVGQIYSNYMATVVYEEILAAKISSSDNVTYPNGNVGPAACPGNITDYVPMYYGSPTNSEGTPDPRSSVQINSVTQVPPFTASDGCWVWAVPNGSNLSCNLNIGIGNVAS